MTTKTLQCKTCGEPVEVPDRQRSVRCEDCAEKDWAETELIGGYLEDPSHPEFDRQIDLALADPGYRKGYLHRKAVERVSPVMGRRRA